MRVLHLGKYFPPVPGGIERFLDELTAEQARSGLQPALLVHHPGRSSRTDDGRMIVRERSMGEWLFVPVSPGWPITLARLISAWRPQIIHIHLPNPWAFALLALPAARRIPWVVHWHADIPLDTRRRALRLAYPLYAWPERLLLQRAAAIICSSEQYLQASVPLQPVRARCHVVPLGLAGAPGAGPAPAWPAPGMRLLTVGRMSYYKGYATLLQALALTEGVTLVMIGSGEQEAALRAQSKALGLQQRVQFAGRVDDATIEGAYRECDVLCLPSVDRAEAFGLVLLEAMRAGKPVVASALAGSGMTALAAHEINGLQARPGDPADLASALARLRDDPTLRTRLGNTGRQRFEQEYRIAPVAQAISRIYREVGAG